VDIAEEARPNGDAILFYDSVVSPADHGHIGAGFLEDPAVNTADSTGTEDEDFGHCIAGNIMMKETISFRHRQ
jgi:hypothetical protein